MPGSRRRRGSATRTASSRRRASSSSRRSPSAWASTSPMSASSSISTRRRAWRLITRKPVAPGAAGFLVISLQALRRVEMDDEADIGLVDAHAEGDRRDDDDALLLEEAVLVALPRRRLEPGMIGQRDAAFHGEPVGDLLDLAPS